MNATVTRSATKKPAAKSVGKTASKSILKAVASKPKKAIVGTSRTVSAKTPATTKAAAKSAKTPAKNSVKSAAGATTKISAKKTGTASAAPVPKAGKGATELKRPRSGASIPSSKETSGNFMSSNKASAGLTDTMKNPVVSKVSEVATKTTKSTPAASTGSTLLTEAEILKMSDKDYMNAAQLAFFKARLQQLERDLLKNAGETTEHLRETVLVPDPADRATIEEEHALELRTRDRERKLLKKVQQSILSIDAGEYGWCEETGEPIGIPRLLARPTATLSLEAQQRRELKQKLYGD
jgi:DnaK suppressor protein